VTSLWEQKSPAWEGIGAWNCNATIAGLATVVFSASAPK
jgi:hypothetical protein